jgi:hypothetical protein
MANDDSSISDNERSGNDDVDTALHILSKVTPFGIIWFKCSICLK